MCAQMSEMSTNPNMMQEMMRNMDRTLVNIENIPGGFQALQRMYSTVQAPMMEGMTREVLFIYTTLQIVK